MRPLFEMHVTLVGNPAAIEDAVSVLGCWKFSKIDGDPVLGAGVKCYATSYDRTNEEHAIALVQNAAEFFRLSGLRVVRVKVERIVYDERFE